MELLIETLIIISLAGASFSIHVQSTEACGYEFDELNCVFNDYCIAKYDIPFFTYQYENDRCMSEGNTVYYDGRNYHPVNLRVDQIVSSNIELRETYGAHVIQSLDVSNNDIHFYPDLPSMENLMRINMSKNVFTEAKLSNQLEMVSLSEIDFSHNAITNVEVKYDEYPYKKLMILYLGYNYITNLPDAVFESFSELHFLDLSHNFINEISVMTFEGLKNLVHLDLSHNKISDISSSLLRFNKLETLDLNNNLIQNIKLNDFRKLNNIKKIDLSSNLIVNIEKNVFSNFAFLENLDLSNNMIKSLAEDDFVNASRLQNINLFKNNIKTLPKDLFKGKVISRFSIKENNMQGSLVKGTFEGLTYVKELILSNQRLTSIEDYAFFGLNHLNLLLLNNNTIRSLARYSFRTLNLLEVLDLTNNQIVNIDFYKDDLHNLHYFLLSKNNIFQVTDESFRNLSRLEFLDLSNNNISKLDPYSFKSLNNLNNFQISNNPISGVLRESTFNGLILLPNLDISCTFLDIVTNNSFDGMTQLKELNISHSRVNELQFNAFFNTGRIQILDLSYNHLMNFEVNTTDLCNLNTLILNNNFIKVISYTSFKGLQGIVKLLLFNNQLEIVHKEAFNELINLNHMDLSFNPNLQLNVSLDKAKNLASLFLSAIKCSTFTDIGDVPLTKVVMSHSKVNNITALRLQYLKYLRELSLSNNEIVRVEVGDFSNVIQLTNLDLSFNKITFIQAGVFKDNEHLYLLNISHNSLTTINYGIFSGLSQLNTIDISYNNISDLDSERFYEVRTLYKIIADYNKIESVKFSEFLGTNLRELSIGGNPLLCSILVKLKKENFPLSVTALKLDENNGDENVNGVTCNMNKATPKIPSNDKHVSDDKILIDIRDILRNLTFVTSTEKRLISENNATKYLANITNLIGKFDIDKINSTNFLLAKILDELKSFNVSTLNSNGNTILKGNEAVANLMPYINKMKQELQNTIAVEKQNILTEIDSKLSSRTEGSSKYVSSVPTHDSLLNIEKAESKSLIFLEVGVGLILVVLVGFILYKLYDSRIFVPSPRSYSTRNLPEDMENSNL